jgi:hypothetical protein
MLAREKHFSAWGRSDIAAYLVRWEMLDLEEAARGTNGTFCAGERKRRHGLRWTLSSPSFLPFLFLAHSLLQVACTR